MIEIDKVNSAYKSVINKQKKGQPLSKELSSASWMIEELKVSLYAQNLKTPYPISSKRVLNYLKDF